MRTNSLLLLAGLTVIAPMLRAADYPEGPIGDHLQAIVETLRNPQADRVETVVKQHMSRAMQEYPMQAHLEFFQEMNADLGDFEVQNITANGSAIGYTNLSPMGPDSGFVRENTGILPGIGSPAGSSYSTVSDLVRFDQALWSDGPLSEATRRLFFSIDQVDSVEEGMKAPFPPVFAAAGGQPGENSVIISVPGKGRRIVVLSNFDERLAEDIGMHLYQQLKATDSDGTSP